MAVSLGTLQRHCVISMAAVIRKAGARRSWCNLVLPPCCSRRGDGGAAGAPARLAPDAPFLGPSGASGQQPTALPFSPIYPGVFSQLLSLPCLRMRELNSYLSIQPSCSFLPTKRKPPFCLLILYTSSRKTFLTFVLPSACFYIHITCVSYADLEHGTFCIGSYSLISPPGELFKGKTLGMTLTHQCLSSTQHRA